MSKKIKKYNEERGTWQSYELWEWMYMEKIQACPRCNRAITTFPALSRRDNKTDICSDCGTAEGLEDYANQPYDGHIYWKEKTDE